MVKTIFSTGSLTHSDIKTIQTIAVQALRERQVAANLTHRLGKRVKRKAVNRRWMMMATDL